MLDLDELGIFDADGHIMEDVPAIIERLPEKFHESSLLNVTGIFPGVGPHPVSLARLPEGAGSASRPEDWAQFIADLSLRAAVIYPSYGLAHGWTVDVDMAIGTARAYNDWLAQTYLPNPTLKGMALVPMHEPDAAVDELKRAVTELGMLGAVLPATGLSQHLGAKAYWPIYAEAERLQCCISVHGGIHGGLGFDKVNVLALHNAFGHAFSQSIALGTMVYNGIFDRFPNLRVAYLEGGLGWLVMAMERLSGSYSNFTPIDPRKELVQLDPGESVADYIAKRIEEGRIFLGIEGDEDALPAAIDMVGDGPFMFSSDFPHEVNLSTIRHELDELLENGKIPDSTKCAILRDNAQRFYQWKGARP
jgi:predicted TIM-barrel fold metal-dependent hydrolase